MKIIIKEYLKVALLIYLVHLAFGTLLSVLVGWDDLLGSSLVSYILGWKSIVTAIIIFPYILLIFLYNYFFKLNIFSRSVYIIGPLIYIAVSILFILIPSVEEFFDNIAWISAFLILSITITALVIIIEKLWLILCKKYRWNKSIISPEKIDYKKHLLIILIALFIMFIIPEEVYRPYGIYTQMY